MSNAAPDLLPSLFSIVEILDLACEARTREVAREIERRKQEVRDVIATVLVRMAEWPTC